MNKKCIGCGSILQYNNPNAFGYIKKEKYDDSKYCERCYKIIHYNLAENTELNNINEKLLLEINKSKKNIFYIINFFDLNKETLNMYNNINQPKILIINKIDLIPRSLKLSKIEQFLKNNYQIKEKIYFISTKIPKNIKEIINRISLEKPNSIYFVGFTNAGKSSIINKIIGTDLITTSYTKNTTLNINKIKINDNNSLYDVPGFNYQSCFYNKDLKLLKKINNNKELKPITYQTKENTSIIIENKIIISFNSINSITIYYSNDIETKKVFNKKINSNYKFKIEDNTDLIIKGLGFINIKKACNIDIFYDGDNIFETRPSIFNKEV